jgi:hypothetical protein
MIAFPASAFFSFRVAQVTGNGTIVLGPAGHNRVSTQPVFDTGTVVIGGGRAPVFDSGTVVIGGGSRATASSAPSTFDSGTVVIKPSTTTTTTTPVSQTASAGDDHSDYGDWAGAAGDGTSTIKLGTR